MVTSPVGKPEIGNRYAEPEHWTRTEWFEPELGLQSAGEAVAVRTGSTSGEHRAGLWRLTPSDVDGALTYSSPAGDTTIVVLEGDVVATTADGTTHTFGPGSTVSQPRGVSLSLQFSGPVFQAFWVHWNSPLPTSGTDTGLVVGHVDNDDPAAWEPYAWDAEGKHWRCGENAVLRSTGSTGSFRCGIWRSGPDLGNGGTTAVEPMPAGSACTGDRCAGHRISSSRGVGDETMLLLEGAAHIVNHDSGEEVDVKAGDIISQWEGPNITWTSTTAHVKKFWIMTNAALPA